VNARWLSPADLEPQVLAGLLRSFAHNGVTLGVIAQQIGNGDMKLFSLTLTKATAYFAVSKLVNPLGTVLQLDGFWLDEAGQGYKLRSFIGFLKMLARDWGCQRVETAVIDERLKDALLAVGCRLDYWALSVELENEH
jgi:hypothetical protein